MHKIWGFLLILLLIPVVCSAYSIDNSKTDFYLFETNIVVETEIELSSMAAGIEWPVPNDAETISVTVDGEKVNFSKQGRVLRVEETGKNIEISYITEAFIDNENFLLSFIAPAQINNAEFRLIMPEGAVLKKSLDSEMGGSVYPKPSDVTTDGRSMIFVWQIEDMQEGQELPVFVSYKLQKSYAGLIVVLVILLAASITAGFYVHKKKPKVKERIIKEDLIEQHLKEDEEIIVNVLKKRDNRSCEQGTLRIITGFSKATLSRLLKELEDRKVIKKEKRGKKNLIFLK